MGSNTSPVISEDTPLPEAINLEDFKHLVTGYLIARADLGPVTPYRVAAMANINEPIVLLNTRFLEYLGVIEHASQGTYLLTSSGADYARALMWRSVETHQILWKLVKACPLFQAIMSFLASEGRVSRDKMEFHIASATKSVRSANRNVGITTVIQLLASTGKVLEEEGGFLVLHESSDEALAPIGERELLVPSDEVQVVWLSVNGEHYAIERDVLVDYIITHGRKASNSPMTV